MGDKNKEQPAGEENLKITKPEIDAEYSRLIRNAAAVMSGKKTARVLYLILGEARKALSKELQEEIKIPGPDGGCTRRYLILYKVGEYLDHDLEQTRGGIIPDGVSSWIGSTSSHDDERRKHKPPSSE